MEEIMIVIYYCYGLNFCKVAKSKVEDKLIELGGLIVDGAGDDGRQMKIVGVVSFDDLTSAIIRML